MAPRQSDDPLEFYPTPFWLTRALMLARPDFADQKIIEPFAGDGAIARVLRDEYGCDVETSDINPKEPQARLFDDGAPEPSTQIADAMTEEYWRDADADRTTVITNPPFSRASEFALLALRSGRTVAMLCRLTFMEPITERVKLLSGSVGDEFEPVDYNLTDVILLPRTSFTGDGLRDSTASCWMVWQPAKPTFESDQNLTRIRHVSARMGKRLAELPARTQRTRQGAAIGL